MNDLYPFDYKNEPDYSQKALDNDFYPIILVPERIKCNIKLKPSKSEIYKKKGINLPTYRPEKFPEKPLPYYYKEEQKTKYDGCSVFVLVFFVLVFGIIAIPIITVGGFLIIALPASIIFYKLFSGLQISRKENIRKMLYHEDSVYKTNLAEYEKKVKEIELKNSFLKRAYEIDLKKIESTISENEIRKFELLMFYESLKPKTLHVRKIEEVKRGKHELMFLNELYEEFGNQVKMDITPENCPYFPDITLICEVTGLYIDIEIDEPYAYIDRKPIHYIGCEDPARNEYFLDENWCVIRFSEKQIVKQPKECVLLIKNFINGMQNKTLRLTHQVEKENKWTYEESLVMSYSNIRDFY
ncbi:MAG: hypothetical protein LAT68_11330 [Cyclobacteriaceae bacterium]|nr:hypothetical protein [Cyclobacteriaceae bacterium]MCH8516908.1 hypothetical protein [Cyclobacteriaceae bacterium]